MICLGKKPIVYMCGLVVALALSSKGLAQDPLLINNPPADDFAVRVTFQDPTGNTVISDNFSVNDVNFVTSPTTFAAPGYTATWVFSLTHTATQMTITYSGTVGNTAGTNVWTITGPSSGSAIATSNQPAHDPLLGLL